MRLAADEMLRGLGRWLRVAGHDTLIAEPGEGDTPLLARSRAEGRMLLTRDRALAERAGSDGVWLRAAGLDEAAREVRERLGLDWRLAPFSRCLVDNAELDEAGPRAQADLPPRARVLGGPLRCCPACGRLYWPGSHVRRMWARLDAWATAFEAKGPGAMAFGATRAQAGPPRAARARITPPFTAR